MVFFVDHVHSLPVDPAWISPPVWYLGLYIVALTWLWAGGALRGQRQAGAPVQISSCCVDIGLFKSKVYSFLKSILHY